MKADYLGAYRAWRMYHRLRRDICLDIQVIQGVLNDIRDTYSHEASKMAHLSLLERDHQDKYATRLPWLPGSQENREA